VEAAGIEPASANAPSARLYERRSRFGFAFLDGPGRRRKASPLNVPYVPRARTRRVSPLNDTGEPGRGLPGPMGYLNLLSSQHHIIVGVYLFCRRFTSLQQTRLVSLDADRSRRSRYAPLTSDILPFWRGFSTAAWRATGACAPSWRALSRGWRSSWRSRGACRTASCGWLPRSRA
jgi:hypothetical protein